MSKKEKYVCKVCGAELLWRSQEAFAGRVYPDNGSLGKREFLECEIDIECSKDEDHDCGFECDNFEHVREKTNKKA